MIRSIEKAYYPLAVFMILVVLIAVINELMYLLLFIPVFAFLALLKLYIIDQRLHYYGEEALATIVKYKSYVNFDANVASSRRGDVKTEVVLMEFTTKEGENVKGQPKEYDIHTPSIDESQFGTPYLDLHEELKNFNPVGQKYEIIYDRERPDIFIFKELLLDEIGISVRLMQLLGVFIALCFGYIFYTYSVVGTVMYLFGK